MKKFSAAFVISVFLMSAMTCTLCLADANEDPSKESKESKGLHSKMDNDSDHLVVLWTSGDKDVAIKMVFMYVYAAKKSGWWKDITFIVWGPSSKLTSEDSEVQDYLKKMLDEGIVIKACKACADMYGVADKLASLGIEVKYMGQELTDYLKSDKKVITF